MNILPIAIVVGITLFTAPLLHAEDKSVMPPNHPKIELPTQSATHEESDPLSGTVAETMNSGGYSYVHLKKKGGDKVWVAIPQAQIMVGDQMSFKEGLVMTKFESKTLKRNFDKIIFANGIKKHQRPVAATTPALSTTPKVAPLTTATTSAMLGSKAAVNAKEVSTVAKAQGKNAYTIAELYQKVGKLNKKSVTVRGKVVKVTPKIMKRTWVHLQDGSGSQKKGTHNLVITTTSPVKDGDVITATGVLAKDKNFGYGYQYKVLIENAAISRK